MPVRMIAVCTLARLGTFSLLLTLYEPRDRGETTNRAQSFRHTTWDVLISRPPRTAALRVPPKVHCHNFLVPRPPQRAARGAPRVPNRVVGGRGRHVAHANLLQRRLEFAAVRLTDRLLRAVLVGRAAAHHRREEEAAGPQHAADLLGEAAHVVHVVEHVGIDEAEGARRELRW